MARVAGTGSRIRCPNPGPERFFYHSFPRRRSRNQKREARKGLATIRLIKEKGLLCTPEITAWPIFRKHVFRWVSWHIMSRRICFTELSPYELPLHVDIFGHFAVEFGVPVLRHVGALPVIYFPRLSKTTTGLEKWAHPLVERLEAIYILLDRMVRLERTLKNRSPSGHEYLQMLREGKQITSRCTSGAAYDLFSSLTDSIDRVGDLQWALLTLMSLFYPLEDLN